MCVCALPFINDCFCLFNIRWLQKSVSTFLLYECPVSVFRTSLLLSIVLANRGVSRVFSVLYWCFLPFSPPTQLSSTTAAAAAADDDIVVVVCFLFPKSFFFCTHITIERCIAHGVANWYRRLDCVHTHTLDAVSLLRQDCVKLSRKLTRLSGNLSASCYCFRSFCSFSSSSYLVWCFSSAIYVYSHLGWNNATVHCFIFYSALFA